MLAGNAVVCVVGGFHKAVVAQEELNALNEPLEKAERVKNAAWDLLERIEAEVEQQRLKVDEALNQFLEVTRDSLALRH